MFIMYDVKLLAADVSTELNTFGGIIHKTPLSGT